MKTVQLRKVVTTDITVNAAQIQAISITALLDDGTQQVLAAPAVVGDWLIANPESGEVSILSDADFLAEEVQA